MKVNDRLNVGASLDYTWASLDMKLLASPQQFDQMFQFSNGGMTLAQADAYLGTSMNGNFARLDFPTPTNLRVKPKVPAGRESWVRRSKLRTSDLWCQLPNEAHDCLI